MKVCQPWPCPVVGPDAGAGQSVPVADLDGQPERGQRGDPAQTAQTAYYRGELAVGGHRADRLVQAVPAGLGREDGLVLGVEGQRQSRGVEVLSA